MKKKYVISTILVLIIIVICLFFHMNNKSSLLQISTSNINVSNNKGAEKISSELSSDYNME